MTRPSLTPSTLLLLALVAAASAGAANGSGADIAVAARANANPSLAAMGSFAVVTWSAATPEGVTDIYAGISRDGGRSFSAPVRINRKAGDANVNGEQPPRVALVPRKSGDPEIVVVWTAKASSGTRLVSSRSQDGGRSFLADAPIAASESPGNRGWESIATTGEGNVVAIWLDHRDLPARNASAAPMTHAGHQHDASKAAQSDGVARAQLSKLFFGRLSNAGTARALTGGVCYCCKTALTTGPKGSIYAAWRHVYPGNLRDIAFTMSVDGGRTFAPPLRISEDQWAIDGCPENGPTIAVDAGQRIHVVWPTLVPGATPSSEPTLGLFYATSQNGKQFTTRQRIETVGVPRHPQISIDARNEIMVVWDEESRGARRIAVARGSMQNNGSMKFVRQSIADDQSGVYPAVARVNDAAIVAWTSGPAGQTKLRIERITR